MAERVAIVTLGCARNDVDSDELADSLSAEGFALVDDTAGADVVVVNTCGFIASAKKDSIDTILAAADSDAKVVVTGCLAERYGVELAQSLPEASAVLSFDDYPEIGDRLRRVLEGETLPAHVPSDRRMLLPLAPADRAEHGATTPGHRIRRHRAPGPVASVKLASGCDRRCTFCAIPSFRGAFVSRLPQDVLEEVRLLQEDGVREVVLVSENSTSYGKDLGNLRLLEELLTDLAQLAVRVRVSYLQPAEMRPGLVGVIARTPGVAPYFDLSFQHASPTVLRRMRRFGGHEDFLALVDGIRTACPDAGIRSNVIVGFPGETQEDLAILEDFLESAMLDAIGVFGYSDEEGTQAVGLDGHLDQDVVDERVARVSSLADELMLARAEARIGTRVEVLIEGADAEASWGRAAHQGPEDAITVLPAGQAVGELIEAVVSGTDGPDLLAEPG